MKLTALEIAQRAYMMGVNAVFLYENGEEELSWECLFFRQFYLDLLEDKK